MMIFVSVRYIVPVQSIVALQRPGGIGHVQRKILQTGDVHLR